MPIWPSKILSLYIDDVPAADLKQPWCHKTYTPAVFGSAADRSPLKSPG